MPEYPSAHPSFQGRVPEHTPELPRPHGRAHGRAHVRAAIHSFELPRPSTRAHARAPKAECRAPAENPGHTPSAPPDRTRPAPDSFPPDFSARYPICHVSFLVLIPRQSCSRQSSPSQYRKSVIGLHIAKFILPLKLEDQVSSKGLESSSFSIYRAPWPL
ncbi:unnamed protein product [Rhodiola kirilowii]